MISTFDSIISSLRLNVYRTEDGDLGLKIGRFGIHLAPSDAAALARAVLEAVGVEPTDPASKQVRFGTPGHLGHIAFELKRYAEWADKARAQTELEAEALALLNAARAVFVSDEIKWEDVHPLVRERWLAVARRAREMRADD